MTTSTGDLATSEAHTDARFASLLKSWRTKRKLSQLDLAFTAELS